MQLSDTKMRWLIISMAVLSVIVAILAALSYWQGSSASSSNDGDIGSGRPAAGSGSAAGAVASEDSLEDPSEETRDEYGFGGAFSTGYGSSSVVHKVTFRATSDGPVGVVGYVVRRGKIEGADSASTSWSLSRDVRGPRPVAQMAVQVKGTPSYVKCSISVDGKVWSSYTARGTNNVVICTA